MGAKRIVTQLVDLDDVNPSGLADGDSPVWDAAAGEFVMLAGGGGGGGAPTTADYLVGTAQAGLSAEIVVGQTPGGELGGTWAFPTVDTVHSGSSHAATQAAAEAVAAAALAAHDGDTTNVHGIADTSVLATDAELDAMLAQAVILSPNSAARNRIVIPDPGTLGLIITAHAAQTADIQQWQTSAEAVLTKIGPTGCWTIQPSALGLTGAVLIDAGTPPLVDPNSPQRATFNLKATPSLATDGEVYGVRFGSYRDSNFDHPNLGKYDWLFDSYETGGDTVPYLTMEARRLSDRKALTAITLGSSNITGVSWPAADQVAVGFFSLGVEFGGTGKDGGLKLHDLNDFVIYDAFFATDPRLAFQRVAGTWKFGIGAMAPTPAAVNQSASTLAALWVMLKSHGWLDAGSTVPTVYEPGGTDVAVADGGTGASTAAGARTNLDVPSNAEAVLDSLYDANSVLAADTDNTPAALTMGASTILARLASGNIKAAIPAEIAALLKWQMTSALAPTGALAETALRNSQAWYGPGGSLVSQRLTMCAIGLLSGVTVTSISFMSSSTALSGGNHQYFGLFDDSAGSSSGTAYALLRGSADDTSAAWGTGTVKTLNLTTPYVTTRAGVYYLGILVDASTVPLLQAANPATAIMALPPTITATANTGIIALPNPATGFGALANLIIYGYVS